MPDSFTQEIHKYVMDSDDDNLIVVFIKVAQSFEEFHKSLISQFLKKLEEKLKKEYPSNKSLLQNYFSAYLKHNFHLVLYLKNKLKIGFFNFHAGKTKVENLWTHFGHTSPIV